MKKRLSLLIIALLVLTMTITACSPVAEEYLKKSKEVSQWENTVGTANFEFSLKDGDSTLGSKGEFEARYNNQDKIAMKGKVDLSLFLGTDKGLQDFELYLNKGNMIMNKALLSGVANELDDIEESYIGVKSLAAEGETLTITQQQKIGYEFIDFFKDLLTDSKVKFDITKSNNTYKYEVKAEEISDTIIAVLKTLEAKPEKIDEFVKIYETYMTYSGVYVVDQEFNSEEQLAEISKNFKEMLNELDIEEFEKEVKEGTDAFKGSYIKSEDTFLKDKLESKMEMLFKFEDTEFFLKMNTNSQRKDILEIEIPKDVKWIDLEELILSQMPEIAEVDGEIQYIVVVNEREIEFSDQPEVIQGTTILELRPVSEAVGAEVNWNNETRTVTIVKGENKVEFVIGSKIAKINGEEKELILAPRIRNGRTEVPFRVLLESLNLDVDYEDLGNVKLITGKDK